MFTLRTTPSSSELDKLILDGYRDVYLNRIFFRNDWRDSVVGGGGGGAGGAALTLKSRNVTLGLGTNL